MMFKLFRSKFYLAIFLMIAVLLMGILGYRFYAGYTWIDALYMTIITIATVGYREIAPLSDGVKLFTIILIVSSIFIFTYSIAIITEYILAKNTFEHLKIKKMKKKIQQLTGHVIVCGYGRNGKEAAARLETHKRPFVVIERDRNALEAGRSDIFYIEGNANDDQVLMEAGIERASYLIVTLPDDADNLFIVLSARQLNKDLTIISRASEIASPKKLLLAGADKIVMPDKIGGDHMASLVVFPDLMEFLENLSVAGEHNINLEEVGIEELSKTYKYKTISELNLRKRTGCTIIGYKKPEEQYILNPSPELQLVPNSKLIVLGQPAQIKKLNEIFKIG